MKHKFYFSIIFLFTLLNISAQETQTQYLSGRGSDDAVKWDFFCTEGRGSGVWTTINVPSCWELQGFGTYQYGMPFYGKADPPGIAKERGLYKYRFLVPQEWNGKIIKIVFEGVMTDCSVNINGRQCVKLHQGAFYRFESDITDRVFTGKKENILEVNVSKESANASVNLAERRADYWNFGGIFRPVYLIALPPQNIERTTINALADGSFQADVFLGEAAATKQSIAVTFMDKNKKTIGKALEIPVPSGSDKIAVRTQLQNIQTWTAETPNLYFVKFTLQNEKGETQHIVTERFGFRTIEVRQGDGLYINGQKMLVRGVNRHSFRPESGRTLNRTANYDDVKLMKSMNMNAVRLSHYPPDVDFLDACDELGLYVMDELGGWHGKYDTAVGVKLVGEMVKRDVNHPSIIWWSNGNEGGHNFDLDSEFPKYDIQKRPVLHPQKNFGGFETMHYRSYGESLEYMRQPEIWMPTEILHGMYDGGHGAGLWDYWEIYRRHPRSAGAFLWVLADEGVLRTDLNGKIDNVGNYAADGIVGPHHEKEGSYFTIKQIWSPVQILTEKIDETFDGTLTVENRYDFTNLSDCRFVWTLKSFANAKETKLKTAEIKNVTLPPHSAGKIKIDLPSDWKNADALYLEVLDPQGNSLWIWDWTWKTTDKFFDLSPKKSKLAVNETEQQFEVTSGNNKFIFSKITGRLAGVEKDGNKISFGNGPRFIAARRGDRSKDVFYNHDDKESRSKERIYFDISGQENLISFACKQLTDSVIIDATYTGDMRSTHWVIDAGGNIRLDYQYEFNGTTELLGVCFDYPENQVVSKTWLGKGSYRVWQNRIHGTQFGIWNVDYNDPLPAETFIYPEFKGYFADWRWLTLKTTEGDIWLGNGTADSYLGVYTPRDGRDLLLYTLPETGIAILKVIPAVRNKVNATDLIGPQSQAQWVYGLQKGSVWLKVN
ncbi:MAG: DUF4981 domain-containing protein [Paludibacter sp.]|nr:DUF4981 domain-containing protein [Paludibacter sp.]